MGDVVDNNHMENIALGDVVVDLDIDHVDRLDLVACIVGVVDTHIGHNSLGNHMVDTSCDVDLGLVVLLGWFRSCEVITMVG